MRCIAGDRAVIVSGFRDNIGCIVEVVRKASQPDAWVVKTLTRVIARDRQSPLELRVMPIGTLAVLPDRLMWPLVKLKAEENGG